MNTDLDLFDVLRSDTPDWLCVGGPLDGQIFHWGPSVRSRNWTRLKDEARFRIGGRPMK